MKDAIATTDAEREAAEIIGLRILRDDSAHTYKQTIRALLAEINTMEEDWSPVVPTYDTDLEAYYDAIEKQRHLVVDNAYKILG